MHIKIIFRFILLLLIHMPLFVIYFILKGVKKYCYECEKAKLHVVYHSHLPY